MKNPLNFGGVVVLVFHVILCEFFQLFCLSCQALYWKKCKRCFGPEIFQKGKIFFCMVVSFNDFPFEAYFLHVGV